MTVGEKLAYYRDKKNISLSELSKLTNIPKTNLQRYEKGTTKKIPIDVIPILEKALSLPKGTLMGWEESSAIPLPLTDVYMRPIYDSAAAGFNVLAQDTIVGYHPAVITVPSEQDQYIWINVVGDSMAPKIDNGDKVLIRRQESVDSGQIAVVLIDGEEAVVKRVMYGDDWIELHSINPYYPPRRFEGAEVQRVRVMGLVKEVSKTI